LINSKIDEALKLEENIHKEGLFICRREPTF
jgi:hypothetical protein